MQTTKKSKIFLALLFLAALLFVSCSFEDTLGTNGKNTGENNTNTSGGTSSGGSSGGNSGSGGSSSGGNTGGGSGGSIKNDGSSIPKTYHGKYTKVGNRNTSYITIGNDNTKGDYIMQEGGSKDYVKDFVYDSAENTWRKVSPYGHQSSETLQYILKTEGRQKTLIFRIIRTYIPKNSSTTNTDFTYFL